MLENTLKTVSCYSLLVETSLYIYSQTLSSYLYIIYCKQIVEANHNLVAKAIKERYEYRDKSKKYLGSMNVFKLDVSYRPEDEEIIRLEAESELAMICTLLLCSLFI